MKNEMLIVPRSSFLVQMIVRVHRLEIFRQLMADQYSSGLDGLDQRSVLHYLSHWLHSAVAVGVDQPALPRVHADRAGDLLHLHFDREGRLGHGEAAHGRGGLAIGVDAVAIDPHVWDGVWAGKIGHMLLNAVGRMAVV